MCHAVYAGDVDFCPNDGTALQLMADGTPPPHYQFGSKDVPTQVFQIAPTKPSSDPAPSKWMYLALGAFGAVVIGATVFVLMSGRVPANEKFPTEGNPIEDKKQSEVNSNLSASNPVNTPPPTVTAPKVTVSPQGRWTGDWSSPSGAYLTLVIDLNDAGNGRISGQIQWTLRRTTRPEKMSKIGMSATEFVSGQFDENARTLTMSGYRKDDPYGVLVMLDTYRLNLASDNSRLNGNARNGGKWNARLNLAR